MNIEINYLAVLVAAVAAFIIGFLWHGPLFGAQWIKLMGIPQSEIDAMRAQGMGPMVPRMIAGFVQQIVTAFVTAMFAAMIGVTDVLGALQLAFWLWLGYLAMPMLNGVLWEKRTMPLYVFNIIYQLVSLVTVALIVGLWR